MLSYSVFLSSLLPGAPFVFLLLPVAFSLFLFPSFSVLVEIFVCPLFVVVILCTLFLVDPFFFLCLFVCVRLVWCTLFVNIL